MHIHTHSLSHTDTHTQRQPTNIPVAEVMLLECLASQRKNIQKGPEGDASVTQVQDNILQLLGGEERKAFHLKINKSDFKAQFYFYFNSKLPNKAIPCPRFLPSLPQSLGSLPPQSWHNIAPQNLSQGSPRVVNSIIRPTTSGSIKGQQTDNSLHQILILSQLFPV